MNIDLPREAKRAGYFILLVTGGRTFSDEAVLMEILDLIEQMCDRRDWKLCILQGGAAGADGIARRWAKFKFGDIDLITEHADWKAHGKAAGPRRNQLMLDKHNPDFFIAVPGGNGTADMVRRCKAAGVPGIVYRPVDRTDLLL